MASIPRQTLGVSAAALNSIRTTYGQNTSSEDTSPAIPPPVLNRCRTETTQSPINAQAYVKPTDILQRACQHLELDEPDTSLYKHVMKRLYEKDRVGLQCRLRLMFSHKEVVVTFGEGNANQELLALTENGTPTLLAFIIPKTIVFTCPAESQFLESSSVRKATENFVFSEEDSKLVKFTESYIRMKTGKPGQQIKDVTLTISLNNGDSINICHGNKSQKITCMTDDGKPTWIWEYRIEPNDVMDKLNILYQETPIKNEKDKTLYKYLLGRLHTENFRLKGGRLRIVLESDETLTVVFGEGEQDLLAYFSNGSPELTSAFQSVEYTFPEQSQCLESSGVEKPIEGVFLSTAETRIVDYAKETITKINGKPRLMIENTTVTISLGNGRSINIKHGRHESQQLNFYMKTDGTPFYEWEKRDKVKKFLEILYDLITDCSNLTRNKWLLNILNILPFFVNLVRQKLFSKNDKKAGNNTKTEGSLNGNKTELNAQTV